MIKRETLEEHMKNLIEAGISLSLDGGSFAEIGKNKVDCPRELIDIRVGMCDKDPNEIELFISPISPIKDLYLSYIYNTNSAKRERDKPGGTIITSYGDDQTVISLWDVKYTIFHKHPAQIAGFIDTPYGKLLEKILEEGEMFSLEEMEDWGMLL